MRLVPPALSKGLGSIYIYIYIYIFHPRYLHNDIFRYMTCYFTYFTLYCTGKLITLIVIATWPNLSIFLIFTASSGVAYPNQVRAAAKILAGVWVAPTTKFTL